MLVITPLHMLDKQFDNQVIEHPSPIPVIEPKILKPIEPIEQVNIEPIEEIRVVKTTPTPASAPTQSIGGTPQEWMKAAGIPESDWTFVDCVINGCQGVSAEGGWHGTQRWNTAGSGAYGLCQSLPASKMASAGADYMTNPITQLKWCHGYAQQYGGWSQAWNFRKCVGSCYSARTGGQVSKDHTWW